jgi:hypothetical protein
LAIDDFVKVSGIADVGGLHSTGAEGCEPLRLADGCTTHTLTNSPNDLPRYETNVLMDVRLCAAMLVLFFFVFC